uniref:E3 ubiquitin-protein ligase NRDP1 n=1 Tax=Castor canadensis TaxID=51338 RepID=A0A8C0X1Q4_CASCN
MGYDVTRFQGDVDEDLICPICSGVLEEPVQAPHCEHAFCNACITQWFSQQQTCPVDRSVVTVAHLRPVPRIMRNMLSKLQIACDNAVFGCSAIVRLDNLMSHLSDCEHNPKRPVTCEQGCGLEMPKDELPNHNCIKHLRSVVQQQQTRIAELEKTSAEHKHQLAEQVGPREHGGEHVHHSQITAEHYCEPQVCGVFVSQGGRCSACGLVGNNTGALLLYPIHVIHSPNIYQMPSLSSLLSRGETAGNETVL